MSMSKDENMLTWVSLVHAGTYLPGALNQHLLVELGISLAEQDLLKQLNAAGGKLKLIELSRRLYLSKAGVTKMMDRLESAGLVRRERSEADRRVINARLTPNGKEAFRRSRKLLGPWVKSNLAAHLSDKQLRALLDALQCVLEGHDRWEGQMAHLRGEGT